MEETSLSKECTNVKTRIQEHCSSWVCAACSHVLQWRVAAFAIFCSSEKDRITCVWLVTNSSCENSIIFTATLAKENHFALPTNTIFFRPILETGSLFERKKIQTSRKYKRMTQGRCSLSPGISRNTSINENNTKSAWLQIVPTSKEIKYGIDISCYFLFITYLAIIFDQASNVCKCKLASNVSTIEAETWLRLIE